MSPMPNDSVLSSSRRAIASCVRVQGEDPSLDDPSTSASDGIANSFVGNNIAKFIVFSILRLMGRLKARVEAERQEAASVIAEETLITGQQAT